MATLTEALDEVCARFLAELPEDEVCDATRLGFHLEQAHWYYIDFLQPEQAAALPSLSFRAFAEALAAHAASTPSMPAHVRAALAGRGRAAAVIDAFTTYKRRIPTCGAIVLDRRMESALVVCGSGSRTWTFPKGKIARDEDPADCARREVLEETGFDIARYMRREAFIQIDAGTHGGGGERRAVRLYIVPTDLDVSASARAGVFLPQARNEIGDIQWHPVRDLARGGGREGTRYYHVQPFMGRLISWIASERGESPRKPDNAPSPKTDTPPRTLKKGKKEKPANAAPLEHAKTAHPLEGLQAALRRHMAALDEPALDTARLFALYTSAGV